MKTIFLFLLFFLGSLPWADLAQAGMDSDGVHLADDNQLLQVPVSQANIVAPQLLKAVVANYPNELLPLAIYGNVLLSLVVDANGLVQSCQSLQAPHALLANACLSVCKQMRFRPAQIAGKDAAVGVQYLFVFQPTPPSVDPNTQILQQPHGTIKGKIFESGIREPVAFAKILLLDSNYYYETDANGLFFIDHLPAGHYRLKVTATGFRGEVFQETLLGEQVVDVKYFISKLRRDPYESIVVAQAPRREASKIQLSREELSKVAGTFGDPLRVLENLPGMGRAFGGLGGALLVRGANPQDTAVLVDGMSVPALYHLFGLTSVLNGEFLESIDFYPGGFQARYGRATAGVVDVVTRDLRCPVVHGSAKVDIIDATAYGCVPLGNSSWHLAAAIRRSYIDAILPPLLRSFQSSTSSQGILTVVPIYMDYQVKAAYHKNRHQLDLFVFGSSDNFTVARDKSNQSFNFQGQLNQGFVRLIAKHRWQIDSNLLLLSTLSPDYTWQTQGVNVAQFNAQSNLHAHSSALALREDLKWDIHQYVTLRAGIDWSFAGLRLSATGPFSNTAANVFPSPTFDYANTQTLGLTGPSLNHAYWLETALHLPYAIDLFLGLRLEELAALETHRFVALPRINIRYRLLENTTLKGAWGLFAKTPSNQYIVPRLGNPDLQPERSMHVIVGVEQKLPYAFLIDLQGFYNKRDSLAVPSLNVDITNGTNNPENYSNSGEGHTFGIELMLRKNPTPHGIFYGWLSYTLSQTKLRYDTPGSTYHIGEVVRPYDNSYTSWFLGPFDQTHILTLLGQFIFPWGFEGGFRLRYVTGNPYTPYEKAFYFYDADADGYELDLSQVGLDGARLPAFVQLDLRVDKNFVFKYWKFAIYIEIINASNSHNVEFTRYDYDYQKKQYITFLPVIPNLGLKGEF